MDVYFIIAELAFSFFGGNRLFSTCMQRLDDASRFVYSEC